MKLKAIETIRHRLSVAISVDDHFMIAPTNTEVVVRLSNDAPAVKTSTGGTRHPDGTYRFIDLAPGLVDVRVEVPDETAFTWTTTTSVALPLADPRVPVVIELWPSPKAASPAGALAVRGRLEAPIASPVAPGQEVQLEALSGFPPRNRRTRIDADREFLFPLFGPMSLTADHKVQIDVTVPGRTVASIDVVDGDVTTNFPGTTFDAPPGGEIRAVINLS